MEKKNKLISEFSNGILLLVVSGIPSHTCRTAKGQNHKVKSMVAHILQILYNSSSTVHVPPASHDQLQIIALFWEPPLTATFRAENRSANISSSDLLVNSYLEGYGGKLLKSMSSLPDDVNVLTIYIF